MGSRLAVVVWKWGDRFAVDHVWKMRSMLKRHLRMPHDLVVIGDDIHGLPSDSWFQPIWKDWPGRGVIDDDRVRRLQLLDPYALTCFGSDRPDRILQLDLDLVIVDEITSLIRMASPGVGIYGQPQRTHRGKLRRFQYNPSMLLFDRHALRNAWDDFKRDPVESLKRATGEGWTTGDQAVVGWHLSRRSDVTAWGPKHGVHYYHALPDGELVPGSRAVIFYGKKTDPSKSSKEWVRSHWC